MSLRAQSRSTWTKNQVHENLNPPDLTTNYQSLDVLHLKG